MKYRITHGSVPAYCEVNGLSFIYFADGKLPGHREPGDAYWQALPMEVKSAVSLDFTVLFTLPIEKRGEYCATMEPYDVEVEERP
jgi:hypothetical protein